MLNLVRMIVVLALAAGGVAVAGPAHAQHDWGLVPISAPNDSTSWENRSWDPGRVRPVALKNGSCASGYMCLYRCYLAESCGFSAQSTFTGAGCNPIPTGLIYSIKNYTPRKYLVFHNTSCTGTSAPIYPNTAGNMNTDWSGDRIRGIQRTVI